MTGDELRTAYLSFFEEKGHTVLPSSSLVPQGDPTLLLTSAGMVPIKPYYLGEQVPPNRRLASCQKCFRATDIDEVGDAGHLTFFEMLGNFSVGDYFKKEAIAWAWQFVTERLKLPPQRLWITVFTDDDEAFGIWREIGIPADRILRYGEEENYWGPAGDSGPCGPCSEIIYDFGEDKGCDKEACAPDCDCGRFSEIWNLVFTQFNQDKEGNRTPLPRPNIDTGMGLERVAAIMQGKDNVYESDFFVPLLEHISRISGKQYGGSEEIDTAMRIVAEHSRGIPFLIADGLIPGNEGRGYVLRRLLRRAVLFGRRLGLDKPFLVDTARVTIEQMKHIYPELAQRGDFIVKAVELEEARFSDTLNTGLELLDGIIGKMEKKGKDTVSGERAFKLYDTYGFPIEMTEEIAAQAGFSVDMDGFEKEMKKQRERAQASHRFDLTPQEEADLSAKLEIDKTCFVGYGDMTAETAISAILVDGESVETADEGQEAGIVLETTPFYGEMGGQVGDTGKLTGPEGLFAVDDTVRTASDITVHQGRVTQSSLKVGDEVEAEVDVERRLDIARNHTATHLLHYALRQVLGDHVHQRGSLVSPDRLRFDFSHLNAMMPEEVEEVAGIVNSEIRRDLEMHSEEAPYKEVVAAGAIAIFDEKYGDVVRVMRAGKPPISTELCGGTHVSSTGEIGFFHIIAESSIGAGLRRIEAVTGRGAEAFIGKRLSDLQETAECLDTELDSVLDKVSSLISQLNWERKQRLIVERQLSRETVSSLLAQAEDVNGVKVLAAEVPPARLEALREMSDLIREKLASVVIVLGTVYDNKPLFLAAVTPDLVEKGYKAGDIVNKVAKVAGGGGGGKPQFAQAGGRDKKKVGQALRLVKTLI